MTREELRRLPKIELHCHLDGSLSREWIEARLGRAVPPHELSVGPDCGSLAEYLEKFTLPGACLRDEEGLEGAGYDLLRTMSGENVIYAEIRFAPLLSATAEMGTAQAVSALLRGLERGRRDFGVEYGVITCAMRHHDPAESLRMLKTAREFLGAGVCAADLAGSEAQYPMSGFMDLFRQARDMGMPFTIHAGECGSARNIMDALDAGAGRLGHGTAMRGDPALQKRVREAGVGVEMCPVSNLQTRAVPSAAEYPIREFLDAGLLVTVNTDNRTVSGTSLTGELELIQKNWGIRDSEILLLMRNAAAAAFVDEDTRARLIRKLEKN